VISALLNLSRLPCYAIQSILGFLKVATVVLPPATLRSQLKDIVDALTLWNDDSAKWRGKIKKVLGILVRRYGPEVRNWISCSHIGI